MSFTKPNLPAVDPHTFLTKPLMERMRILTVNWAENGFGSPRMVLRPRWCPDRDDDIGASRVLARV